MSPHHASITAAVVTCSLALASSLAPFEANAQSTAVVIVATDVVQLRDGTILRGQVTESRPGQSITIVLLTGEVRTLPWSSLAAPPTSAPRSERDAYLTPAPDRVPVDIESNGRPVEVGVQTSAGSYFSAGMVGGYHVMASGQTETHMVLCQTPCRLYVRPGLLPLWTGGRGNHPVTNSITVPVTGLALDAYTSSHSLWWVGIFGSVLGGTGTLFGGLALVFPPSDDSPIRCYQIESCRNLGIGLVAGGAALMIAGIWLTATNGGGVTVRQRREAPFAAAVVPTGGGAMLTAVARF